MLKRDEATLPDSCWNKALDDERTFVLLARDECAPDAIRHWVHLRILAGKNNSDDAQMTEALQCADLMEAERERRRRLKEDNERMDGIEERLQSRARHAFTLVELLVVIAIIAALAALTAGASVRLIESQQIANTQSVLDRVQGELNKMVSKVKDQAYKEVIPPETQRWIADNLAGSDANSNGRIRVLYVKLKLRQALPMNFTEALYPPLSATLVPCPHLEPLPGYVSYLHSKGVSISSGLSWESSACLLMALERGVSGAGISPDTLMAGGAGGVGTIADVPILTDAWGRPIYFSRVPVYCPVLNRNGAQAGANDAQDPQGYLQAPAWRAKYGGLFQSITQQLVAPPNTSFRIAPMVASGGPGRDRQPGFDPITFAPLPDGSPMFANP